MSKQIEQLQKEIERLKNEYKPIFLKIIYYFRQFCIIKYMFNPSIDPIPKLAKVLGVSVDDLLK
jgi:hypothetical protein